MVHAMEAIIPDMVSEAEAPEGQSGRPQRLNVPQSPV